RALPFLAGTVAVRAGVDTPDLGGACARLGEGGGDRARARGAPNPMRTRRHRAPGGAGDLAEDPDPTLARAVESLEHDEARAGREPGPRPGYPCTNEIVGTVSTISVPGITASPPWASRPASASARRPAATVS